MSTMKLPKEISKLIELGKWNAAPNCTLENILKNYYGWSGSVNLSSGPVFSDGGIKNAAKDIISKEALGVYLTGELNDTDNLDYIDGNKCMMIACNYDEEAICLDYRFSNHSPRIMASDYSKYPGRWTEIVSSVDELIDKLEITKSSDNL